MREIKFRAWYEKEKRFLSWDELQDGTESLQTYFNNELSDVSPLMQYTGLKDKSGREIYEGDIILFNNFGDTLDKVVYSSGCFHTSGRGYLLDKIREIEVIGNIYENPELLEEKRTLSKRRFTE